MRAGRVFGSVMVAVMVVSSVVVGQATAAPVGTDDTVTVGEAAGALADVASVTGPSAMTVASSEGFTAAAAGSVVELPKDPTDGLSLTTASGASIEIGLPGAANADDGVRQASGEVVYADALPDVAVAAQATPDGGMRALVVIAGPQAPTEFRFPMTVPAGASLVATGDGGAAVIGVDGTPIVQIAPPWAYDANGTGVDTSYRIDGSTLIQKIDHVGSTYPVVADPNLGWFGVCDFWSSSTHEVESWNRSVQATKGGKFFTLRVVMTCGEAGAGGYGWRHVRNSTYGQDHSAELSAALEKAFGYGINEYNFLDNVSAVIRHGLATPAAGNQV
jgi:hypothetical protein